MESSSENQEIVNKSSKISPENRVVTYVANLLLAGATNVIDTSTNPSKLYEWGYKSLPDMIHKAYNLVGATPLGDVIPEYAAYSSDFIRLISWYSCVRMLTAVRGTNSEEKNRAISAVGAFIPAVIYEIGQGSKADPIDIAAYAAGVTVGYFLDKKIIGKLAEMITEDDDGEIPESIESNLTTSGNSA